MRGRHHQHVWHHAHDTPTVIAHRLHADPRVLVVRGGQRLFRAEGELPQAIAGIHPRPDAVKVFVMHEDVVIAVLVQRLHLIGDAGLEHERLHRAANVQQEPRFSRPCLGVRDGAFRAVRQHDRMICVEERLPIVAFSVEAALQHLEHQLVRVRGGGMGHHVDLRRIDAQPIIFDILAPHPQRGFELPIFERIARAHHRLDVALAQPFAHLRNAGKPAIGFIRSAGPHVHRDLVPIDRRCRHGLVEEGIEAAEHLVQQGCGNVHVQAFTFLGLLLGFPEGHCAGGTPIRWSHHAWQRSHWR